MSRTLRIQAPNLLFHIINRGNARQNVFRSPSEYREYLQLLKNYKTKFPVRLYHYVLMPNHVHMLLEPMERGALSAFMQGLTLAHTRRFNLRSGSVGHAWQGRFKSILIESDQYYLQCARYIELNPVRANMVSHPSYYSWSSYSVHALGESCDLVDQHPLLQTLGSTKETVRQEYQNFVEVDMKNVLQHTSARFSEKPIYGNDEFVHKMIEQNRLSIPRLKAGRPSENRT
ncbi:MAG: transposase [Candidatus Uhrbacteria bacterium]|nr:transposase [Candidatus Uhrbacteria bacterium]